MSALGRRGFWGPIRLALLLVVLVFVWIVLVPDAVNPGITRSIDSVHGKPNGEMAEMLLRMIPWGFIVILVLSFIWLAVTG
jgi:hypothetical protein